MGNAKPLANDLWQGIGGHFDSLSQVLCEFIDNSISNIIGNSNQVYNRSILINIEQVQENYSIKIEDNGTGISDFDSVLRIGDKSLRTSPLNEHGFGLKHALATANPSNDNWSIYTRTEEDLPRYFRKVSAAYDFDYKTELVDSSIHQWPGRFNGTGTLVEFFCSKIMFNTVQKGIPGLAGFKKCLEYLNQDIGYIYSGVIEKGIANITITSSTANYNEPVQAVLPVWVDFYQDPKPGHIEKDLGGGKVQIEYKFGEMAESTYYRYYKKNMSSSGVEIRINGRLLMSNLFNEIWRMEKHPSYNHFLAVINIVSENRLSLPQTKTSKNGIRSEDEKLDAIFDWIRKTHPKPHKDLTNAISEKELVKELAELKENVTRAPDKHIETEFKVFRNLGAPVSVDLYYYDGTDIVLYEAKKDIADIQNLYQLLMYWDGAVADGLTPTEGILLASRFSPGVERIINTMNSMSDHEGNNYNFICKTWRDERISYPSQ
jgi:hypothetical protein